MIGNSIFEGMASALARMVGRNVLRWIVKILGFFGVSFVSFDAIYNPIMQYAETAWAGLPADLAHWFGALGLDICFTMLISAYVISFLTGIGVRKDS